MTSPLLPVDLLRIPMFALSVGASTCAFTAQTLAFIALPFYLEGMGYSAVQTGILMTPLPLATALLAGFSGKLSDRYPAGLLGLGGLILFASGLAALALLTPMSATLDAAWRTALAGAGWTLTLKPGWKTAPGARPGDLQLIHP